MTAGEASRARGGVCRGPCSDDGQTSVPPRVSGGGVPRRGRSPAWAGEGCGTPLAAQAGGAWHEGSPPLVQGAGHVGRPRAPRSSRPSRRGTRRGRVAERGARGRSLASGVPSQEASFSRAIGPVWSASGRRALRRPPGRCQPGCGGVCRCFFPEASWSRAAPRRPSFVFDEFLKHTLSLEVRQVARGAVCREYRQYRDRPAFNCWSFRRLARHSHRHFH